MYHNFHLFLTCQNSIGLGGISGFLALDTTNQLIILSFQGSRTIQNWIDNLSVIPVAISNICSGCDAHLGFWSTWQSISDTITPHINAAVAQYPSYGLVFTGHSLGAALATVSATVLRLAGHKIDLYTFGSPRVGNHAFAEFVTAETSGANYRITHTDDIVPKLPPRALGFSHFSPEYWITSANNQIVTTQDITVVQGVDSTAGNAGTSGLDVSAHEWYFGPISACP